MIQVFLYVTHISWKICVCFSLFQNVHTNSLVIFFSIRGQHLCDKLCINFCNVQAFVQNLSNSLFIYGIHGIIDHFKRIFQYFIMVTPVHHWHAYLKHFSSFLLTSTSWLSENLFCNVNVQTWTLFSIQKDPIAIYLTKIFKLMHYSIYSVSLLQVRPISDGKI